MDATTCLMSDPWYAINCELHHFALGLCSALAVLAVSYLICSITASSGQAGRRIYPAPLSAYLSLSGLCFGVGLIGHYLADFGFLGNWWKW